MYRLSFYVPESHCEVVKQALFELGVGRFKNYDQCCWQTLGQGQYRPIDQANPFIGTLNTLQIEPEYKVEMICSDELIRQAITTLRLAHPYEEPAYEAYKIEY